MKLEGPICRHLKALVTVVSSPWAEARPEVETSATPAATAASKRDRCIQFLRLYLGERRGQAARGPVTTITLRCG